MPFPWTKNRQPEPESVIENTLPASPSPEVVEARWRANQDKSRYYAEKFISMQEAMAILGRSEEYIRACERLGQIGIERWNGVEYVYRFDVQQEATRIEEFPYPSGEEGK